MSCGQEQERQVWIVRAKGQEWTTPARCQFEAWDNILGQWTEGAFMEQMGLVATARRVEAGEDEEIAIHTVGLAIRYGFDNAAIAADAAGMSIGLDSVRHLYLPKEAT